MCPDAINSMRISGSLQETFFVVSSSGRTQLLILSINIIYSWSPKPALDGHLISCNPSSLSRISSCGAPVLPLFRRLGLSLEGLNHVRNTRGHIRIGLWVSSGGEIGLVSANDCHQHSTNHSGIHFFSVTSVSKHSTTTHFTSDPCHSIPFHRLLLLLLVASSDYIVVIVHLKCELLRMSLAQGPKEGRHTRRVG